MVPSGRGQGKPFRLRTFQKKFIRDVYDPTVKGGEKRRVRRAILSIGRKNGKTALIAALVLVHLVGPEAIPNGEIYSAANDRDQAAIIFKFARQIVEADLELRQFVSVITSTKTLIGLPTASVYRAISAEAGTKHGYNPTMVIYDELARAKSRDLYDVLDTSMGAREEPLFVVISTQSNDPQHILSELIDDGLNANDPTIVCHLYAVPDDCEDVFDPKVWPLANPALGDFRSLADLRASAVKAKRMPAEEPKFRNLCLNQRVSPVSSLISRAEWMACVGEAAFEDGEEVYLALDLSAVLDLTALAMISAGEQTKVQMFAWKPQDFLREHSDRDFGSGNNRYVQWHKDGHLLATPGRAIDKEMVARHIAGLCGRYRVLGMAYDAWHIRDLLKEFERIEFTVWEDKGSDQPRRGTGLRIIPWGQGYKSMGPSVDAFEYEIVQRRLVHSSNPVLNWTMSNAVARTDPAGNRKLDKEAARFRIDPAVALTMACGLKTQDRAVKKPEYKMLFLRAGGPS